MRSVAILVFLGILVILGATVVQVPTDYATIQAGIDAATHGDTVLAQPGVYYESINFNGKRIIVSSLFLTTQDTTYIGDTVIDAQREAYHVVEFSAMETNASKLIGFTITGGLANGDELDDQRGGGIHASMASPTIAFCIVTGNESVDCGGGASLSGNFNHDAVVESCLFEGNSSGLYGGGLHLICLNGDGVVRGCRFVNNIAQYAGGMTCLSFGVEILDSQFLGNTATENSGGLHFTGTGTARRCTFTGNQAARGAAITNDKNEIDQFTNFAILSCTITENTATDAAGAIFGQAGSETILVNSIVYGNEPQEIAFSDSLMANTLAVACCDIEGGQSAIVDNGNATIDWLDGNIDADPLFDDPAYNLFDLTENSPCIDAGAASFTYDGQSFLELTADEYAGAAPDMGASEWLGQDADEDVNPIEGLRLHAYPNPFNPEVTIRFSLPRGAHTAVHVYNVRGQRVAKLCNERLPAGEHAIAWNASEHASGVYLVRMQACGRSITRRVTLLK